MARPAFFKSGYRGKLGDTIGQIQNGKAIIKAYAKPRNPDTPAQKANREKFGQSNKFAMTCLMWEMYDAPNGNERAKVQKACIKAYLASVPNFPRTLSGLNLPIYKGPPNIVADYEAYVYENLLQFQANIQSLPSAPDEPAPHFRARAYVIFYNPISAKLEYDVSDWVESEPEFGGFEDAIIPREWEIEGLTENNRVPYFSFCEVDDRRIDSFYGVAES